MNNDNIIKAITMLQNKREAIERVPKIADFGIEEVRFIKHILGPWTRALEEVGSKEVNSSYLVKKSRNKSKRRTKRQSRRKNKIKEIVSENEK